MYKFALTLMVIFFINACSSQKEEALIDTYKKHSQYHKHLLKTEKIQLYDDKNNTKLMLTATYVPSSQYNNKKENEVFILGLNIDDNENDWKHTYSMILNSEKAVEIQKLNEKDKRLSEISFITEWGSYYIIKFPHQKKETLTLTFENEVYGKGVLNFSKVAKYVLEKQRF